MGVKISALPAASTLTGTELIPLVQGGVTSQSTTGALLPLLPITTAETAASVTPTNYGYPPGDLRRYGADPTGVNDSTTAFQQAAAVQAINHQPVYVMGTFLYGGSATTYLDLSGYWIGAGESYSVIHCSTISYSGEFFRVLGNAGFSDINLQTVGTTKLGTGLNCSPDPSSGVTGNIRISRCNIQGFNYNIDVGNVFQLTLEQVQSQNGNYGIHCAPSSGQEYVADVVLRDFYANANGVNAYFNTPVNSFNISWLNGANQDSTGSSAQAYFNDVFNLVMLNVYGEGNSSQPWIQSNAQTFTAIGLINSSAGSVTLGSGGATQNTFIGYRQASATGVLTSSTDTYIHIIASTFPTSGNTYPAATTDIINSTINSITASSGAIFGGGVGTNGVTPPAQLTGWGVPTGAGVISNFSGSSATLAQCSEAIAQIITTFKALGVYAS